MTIKKQRLSDDFEVLLYIYEQTEINNTNIYFKKIVEQTGMKQNVVSKSIDRLYDKMMIDAAWARKEDGCWAYCFRVSDSFMGFTKGLYNATQELSKDEKNKDIIENIRERKADKEGTISKVVASAKSQKENEFI